MKKIHPPLLGIAAPLAYMFVSQAIDHGQTPETKISLISIATLILFAAIYLVQFEGFWKKGISNKIKQTLILLPCVLGFFLTCYISPEYNGIISLLLPILGIAILAVPFWMWMIRREPVADEQKKAMNWLEVFFFIFVITTIIGFTTVFLPSIALSVEVSNPNAEAHEIILIDLYRNKILSEKIDGMETKYLGLWQGDSDKSFDIKNYQILVRYKNQNPIIVPIIETEKSQYKAEIPKIIPAVENNIKTQSLKKASSS